MNHVERMVEIHRQQQRQLQARGQVEVERPDAVAGGSVTLLDPELEDAYGLMTMVFEVLDDLGSVLENLSVQGVGRRQGGFGEQQPAHSGDEDTMTSKAIRRGSGFPVLAHGTVLFGIVWIGSVGIEASPTLWKHHVFPIINPRMRWDF